MLQNLSETIRRLKMEYWISKQLEGKKCNKENVINTSKNKNKKRKGIKNRKRKKERERRKGEVYEKNKKKGIANKTIK